MKVKAPINLQLRYYFIKVCFATRTRHVALLRCGTSAIDGNAFDNPELMKEGVQP